MASWNIVQKAFYLGVGMAAYAGEKAGGKLTELGSQAQKLAEDLVARGEMTAEESVAEAHERIEEIFNEWRAKGLVGGGE